jgi:hypothetical protein
VDLVAAAVGGKGWIVCGAAGSSGAPDLASGGIQKDRPIYAALLATDGTRI